MTPVSRTHLRGGPRQMQFASESLTQSTAHSTQYYDSSMSLAAFVERRFIPEHVAKKSLSGQRHYHALLKYVLTPETVDRLFIPYLGVVTTRLKSLPNWAYLDHLKLSDIDISHVRRVTACAMERGYSRQTVKHIKNVISMIISHAKRVHMYSGDNPAREIELPCAECKTSHNLTIFQAKALLGAM